MELDRNLCKNSNCVYALLILCVVSPRELRFRHFPTLHLQVLPSCHVWKPFHNGSLFLQIHNREKIDPEPPEILHSDGSSVPQLALAEQPLIWHNGFQHPQVILLPSGSQAAPHSLWVWETAAFITCCSFHCGIKSVRGRFRPPLFSRIRGVCQDGERAHS